MPRRLRRGMLIFVRLLLELKRAFSKEFFAKSNCKKNILVNVKKSVHDFCADFFCFEAVGSKTSQKLQKFFLLIF